MGGRAQPVPIGAAAVDRPGRADPARGRPDRADPDPATTSTSTAATSTSAASTGGWASATATSSTCQRRRRALRSTGAWRSGWPWRWTRCRRASLAQSSNSPSNTANTAPCGSPSAANRPCGHRHRAHEHPAAQLARLRDAVVQRSAGEVGHPVRRNAGLHLRTAAGCRRSSRSPLWIMVYGMLVALHVLEASSRTARRRTLRPLDVVGRQLVPRQRAGDVHQLGADAGRAAPTAEDRAGRIGDHRHASRRRTRRTAPR